MAAHHTYVFNTHGTKCVFKWPKIKLISQCSISSQNSLNKLLVLGHLNRPGRLHIQLNPHFTHKISTYTCSYMYTLTHTYTHICTRKSLFLYFFFSYFLFFYTQTNTHHWLDFHDHNTSQITIHLFSLIYHNLRYFIYRIISHSTQNHQEISVINQ